VLKTYSKSAKISQKALTGYGVNNIYKPWGESFFKNRDVPLKQTWREVSVISLNIKIKFQS
jgi:hypothetical protein